MRKLACALVALAIATPAMANEVNIYSSRHYDTDDALYENFTAATGIAVNRIEDDADVLIERLKSEGELSPADILVTVDVGRIIRAEDAGVLQKLQSEAADAKVPAELHDDADLWVGVTTRARLIFYDKNDVTEPPQTYEALADPRYKGMICTRSSSNVYMLSLLASIIEHDGEEAAKAWAEGVKNNFARDPVGGDTDQLRGLISGECDIVLSNHYYYARAFRQEVEGLTDGIEQIGWVFPNQETTGAHINISGVGIAKYSPNADNARTFIEYLLTPDAQKLLADGNDEFPVVAGIEPSEGVQKLGDFKRDQVALAAVANNVARAQEIYNEVGYK
ncbi:extracellular solute-binding protein [Acuticoccus sp. MNP-M23]|uniref:extracellular solute-binding protein n=1 Tax=Acuticoccus sp. MNP-M23 TaxID=3072793 RepID=UPI0028161D3F|nr:extracellular solute-binding protein [Acuticoccus sp. MNP-M23]WMS44729.1 extracellular solute-binding protein [Acuticoccus sp. MNP-M23]